MFMAHSAICAHQNGMYAGLALMVLAGTLPTVAVSDDCMSAPDARRAVADERLIAFSEAARLAAGKRQGEVISANLCRVNQRLVYVLAVLSRDGHVARVRVDARTRAVQDHR